MSKSKLKLSLNLKIEFGEYFHCLWIDQGEVDHHAKRLTSFLEGDSSDFGYYYIFENGHYLKAKIFQAILKQSGFKSGLYCDESSDGVFSTSEGSAFLVFTDYDDEPISNALYFIKNK